MLFRFQQLAKFLASQEIWPVGILAMGGVIFERLTPVSLAVMLCFWPIRWLALKRLTRRTPADLPIGLLIVMALVTCWVTAMPEITLSQVYRLLIGILLFYTIVNWADTLSRLRWLLLGYTGLGVVLSAAGILSVNWAIDKLSFISPTLYKIIPRLFSDATNANSLAGYLVYLLPLPFGLVLFHWHWIRLSERILISASLLLMGGTIILLQSRGAILSMAAVIVLMSIIRWKRIGIYLAVSGAVMALAGYIIGVSRLVNVITPITGLGYTMSGRMEIWSRALYIIHDFPITGIGMGLYGPVVDRIYPLFQFTPGTVPHAHNLLLQIAVDLGIPGLIAWVATFMIVTGVAVQTFRYGKFENLSVLTAIGAGIIGSQTALILAGMTDAVTWGMVRPAAVVWAVWALPVVAWSLTGQHPLVPSNGIVEVEP